MPIVHGTFDGEPSFSGWSIPGHIVYIVVIERDEGSESGVSFSDHDCLDGPCKPLMLYIIRKTV